MNQNVNRLIDTIRDALNDMSTFIETHGSLTDPAIVRYSDDRTRVIVRKEDETFPAVYNIRQVESHETTNRITVLPTYSYAFIDDRRDAQHTTGVTMMLLFVDIDYTARTFTLRGKRVPHDAVVPGNTHFEDNESFSAFYTPRVPQWTGIVGNGLIEFLVDAHFDSCGDLLVHSSARLSHKRGAFFCPLAYIE